MKLSNKQQCKVKQLYNSVMAQFNNTIVKEVFEKTTPIYLIDEVKFIVIEGMGYSGKTTLMLSLAKQIEATYGRKVKCFRNPGGEVLQDGGMDIAGQALRDIIKQPHWDNYRDVGCTLFLANRLYLMHRINEAIQAGYLVIVDRWDLSSHIYQEPVGELKDNYYYRDVPLQETKLGYQQPDWMIVLHPSQEVAFTRYQTRAARQEHEAYKPMDASAFESWYQGMAERYTNTSAGITAMTRWKPAKQRLALPETETFTYACRPMFNQTKLMASQYVTHVNIREEYPTETALAERLCEMLSSFDYLTINTNPTQEEADALKAHFEEQVLGEKQGKQDHETQAHHTETAPRE